MNPPISSVILYVKDVAKVAAFYERHFGYTPETGALPGWRVLSRGEGCTISLHQAARTQKSGAAIKLVFAVADVPAFVARQSKLGLKFGAIHQADGYVFANAKDPANNSISVSSRSFRIRGAEQPGDLKK
jgi:predicted enzyme related to lactoylglutathione lyase